MSTNSVVGVPHEDSWRGRYVHWDGYPTAMVPDLFTIVARDGYETAVRILTQEHYGWSSLNVTTATLLGRGVDRRDPKRFVEVVGYGTAYTHAEAPDEWWGPSGNGALEEWAYVLEPLGLSCYEGGEGKALGFVPWGYSEDGLKEAAERWENGERFTDEPQPDPEVVARAQVAAVEPGQEIGPDMFATIVTALRVARAPEVLAALSPQQFDALEELEHLVALATEKEAERRNAAD